MGKIYIESPLSQQMLLMIWYIWDFQTTRYSLEICRIRQLELQTLNLSKKEIIGYHWIEDNELLIVTSKSIEFFRMKNGKAYYIRSHKTDTEFYWYSIDCIVMALSPPKIGEFNVLYLKLPKGRHNQTWKFQIESIKTSTNLWKPSATKSYDLMNSSYSRELEHRIELESIYNTLYLLHLHSSSGILNVLNLDNECATRFSISIQPGIYHLKIKYDLIILENYSLQES